MVFFYLICRELIIQYLKPPKKIFIGLGSNLGERIQNLQNALSEIEQKIGHVTDISPVYETPALGFQGNNFLNACIGVLSRMTSEEIMQNLLIIETSFGRLRNTEKGYFNRTLDLDILLIEDEIIASENLNVPHPKMHERRFVLQPLNDIVPEAVHPLKKQKIKELLINSGDDSAIKRIPEELKKPFTFELNKYKYIAVEGNIGAGKTSLAIMISQDFNAKLIPERFKDNPFLPQFYQDPARFAFPLEMSFLADRYQQLADDIAQYDLFTDFVISDYDVFKSLIFAKITLQEEEFLLYQKLFNIMYKELVKPDLYLYLYQKPERLLENIKNRGREYELNIQQDYLVDINKSYLSFIKSRQDLNVKIIDISDLDFVNKREDYLKVLEEM